MSDIVTKLSYAMRLRAPQREALSFLDVISCHCNYKVDSKEVVEKVASENSEKRVHVCPNGKLYTIFRYRL